MLHACMLLTNDRMSFSIIFISGDGQMVGTVDLFCNINFFFPG